MRLPVLLAAGILLAAPPARADEPVDLDLVTRIRTEGFRHSRVMELAAHLTDRIGPRVTGSPAMTEANAWARDSLAAFGLRNAHLESYAFGRGWSWSRCALDVVGGNGTSLIAVPQAWTPGTNGPVEGDAFRMKAEKPEDLMAFAGTLAGKIVFLSEPRVVEPRETAPFSRLSDEDLANEARYEIPEPREGESRWAKEGRLRTAFRRALDSLLVAEGAVAIVEVGSRDHGILRVPRGGEPVDPAPMRVPAVTLMTEQYNRIVRLLEKEHPVRLRLDVAASFHEGDGLAANTVAEIPGTDRRDEVVILGAHLDSYHAGTGATDNAAGAAVMMEAARILRAVGFQPRRTLRVCLWSGEEQGLLGSRAYVEAHFAARPAWTDSADLALPRGQRKRTGPLAYKPEHAKVSAYFNLDNGGGRIRGIHIENNAAVRPIFTAWLEPVADLGATVVTMNPTGSTDHVPFDQVGIPAFQFVQDPLDYMPQTHHSHLDTYDHLVAGDLRQAAVVVATVAAHAAGRDAMLPRKPRPVE